MPFPCRKRLFSEALSRNFDFAKSDARRTCLIHAGKPPSPGILPMFIPLNAISFTGINIFSGRFFMMEGHHFGGVMERADIAIFLFFAGLLTFVLGGIFLIPY